MLPFSTGIACTGVDRFEMATLHDSDYCISFGMGRSYYFAVLKYARVTVDLLSQIVCLNRASGRGISEDKNSRTVVTSIFEFGIKSHKRVVLASCDAQLRKRQRL